MLEISYEILENFEYVESSDDPKALSKSIVDESKEKLRKNKEFLLKIWAKNGVGDYTVSDGLNALEK